MYDEQELSHSQANELSLVLFIAQQNSSDVSKAMSPPSLREVSMQSKRTALAEGVVLHRRPKPLSSFSLNF
jgi:hypothetical protein